MKYLLTFVLIFFSFKPYCQKYTTIYKYTMLAAYDTLAKYDIVCNDYTHKYAIRVYTKYKTPYFVGLLYDQTYTDGNKIYMQYGLVEIPGESTFDKKQDAQNLINSVDSLIRAEHTWDSVERVSHIYKKCN